MRNIARINNHFNRIEAWRDWRALAQQATDAGHVDLVEQHQPPEDAGWRKIDKCMAALRAEMESES